MVNRLKENLEMILESVPEQIKPLFPGSIALQAQKLYSVEYINKSRKKSEIIYLEFVRGMSLLGDGLTFLFSLSALSGLGERESAPAELGFLGAMRYALYISSQYLRYKHEVDHRTDSSD